MEYVHNAWYVAGWVAEFDDSPRRVTMLEQDVVIYRGSSGKLIALHDLCPHRLLPLSMGVRVGDDLQCGYHGMTFGPDGQCTRVPGQSNLPKSACVRSYPIEERNGIVWVWMGDAAKADVSKIFHLPQFDDAKWNTHLGEALHLECHYLNVAENLVDPAHVSFVHPTTLGNAASEDVPVEVETDGEEIVAWRWIRDAPAIGFFQKFGGFSGNVDRWHYYYLHMPSIAVIDFGSADVAQNLKEDERDKGVRIFALHFLTPVNDRYTIDRWAHVRNTAIDDENASKTMDEMFKIAFNEDKGVLEAIQREELKHPDFKPVRIAVDKGPNVYRRRIAEMVAAETATQ